MNPRSFVRRSLTIGDSIVLVWFKSLSLRLRTFVTLLRVRCDYVLVGWIPTPTMVPLSIFVLVRFLGMSLVVLLRRLVLLLRIRALVIMLPPFLILFAGSVTLVGRGRLVIVMR